MLSGEESSEALSRQNETYIILMLMGSRWEKQLSERMHEIVRPDLLCVRGLQALVKIGAFYRTEGMCKGRNRGSGAYFGVERVYRHYHITNDQLELEYHPWNASYGTTSLVPIMPWELLFISYTHKPTGVQGEYEACLRWYVCVELLVLGIVLHNLA